MRSVAGPDDWLLAEELALDCDPPTDVPAGTCFASHFWKTVATKGSCVGSYPNMTQLRQSDCLYHGHCPNLPENSGSCVPSAGYVALHTGWCTDGKGETIPVHVWVNSFQCVSLPVQLV